MHTCHSRMDLSRCSAVLPTAGCSLRRQARVSSAGLLLSRPCTMELLPSGRSPHPTSSTSKCTITRSRCTLLCLVSCHPNAQHAAASNVSM